MNSGACVEVYVIEKRYCGGHDDGQGNIETFGSMDVDIQPAGVRCLKIRK